MFGSIKCCLCKNRKRVNIHQYTVLVYSTGMQLKLFGMFNVHINRSGSYWDNHVLDLSAWPCLEITLYQRLQGSFMCHWGSNDTYWTAIIVIIQVTMYPPTRDWTWVNGVPGGHVTHSTTGGHLLVCKEMLCQLHNSSLLVIEWWILLYMIEEDTQNFEW